MKAKSINQRQSQKNIKRPLLCENILFEKLVIDNINGKSTLMGKCGNIIMLYQIHTGRYKGISKRHTEEQFLKLAELIKKLPPLRSKRHYVDDIVQMRVSAVDFIKDNHR